MIDDLKKTGHCRFSKARETFFRGYLHWALPKNSLFRNAIDKGLVEWNIHNCLTTRFAFRLILLDAFGFSEFWRRTLIKKAGQCLQPDSIKALEKSRLTLRQLSVAFWVLGIGCFTAFCAFLVEGVISRRTKKQEKSIRK